MLPVPAFVRAGAVPARAEPVPTALLRPASSPLCAWAGLRSSAALVAGAADDVPLWAAMALWAVLWVLYLSIVNVGQTWYGFGWESLLLEAGFLAVFLGNERTAPPVLVLWLLRWLLFRVEFGAGLIKIRGDQCWRELTCLYYHHETQPMPGPLSWFFHHLPKPLHRVEVAANHVTQLVVPVLLFTPQPVASVAAGDHRAHPAVAGAVRQLRLAELADDHARPLRRGRLAASPASARAARAPPLWYEVVVIAVTALLARASATARRATCSRAAS